MHDTNSSTLLNRVDWEALRRMYLALDHQWQMEVRRHPTAQELEGTASMLLGNVGPDCANSSTGGLEARYHVSKVYPEGEYSLSYSTLPGV